jgi:cob(I)alamin adenosyltransferase
MMMPGAPLPGKDPDATGQPEPKDSQRMEAVGGVDELNSIIGLALSQGVTPRVMAELPVIQRELIQLASNLAFSAEEGQQAGVQMVQARQVARLEDLTDELNRELGPLGSFILPGGAPGAAQLHVARAVTRRVERDVIRLSRQEAVGNLVLPYLCRLSHALFAMARYENRSRNVPDTIVERSADQAKDRPGRCC